MQHNGQEVTSGGITLAHSIPLEGIEYDGLFRLAFYLLGVLRTSYHKFWTNLFSSSDKHVELTSIFDNLIHRLPPILPLAD